jgi:3-isopropylmalate dehydrogenase
MRMKIAVLAGDGIGQEVVPAALAVLRALSRHGLDLEFEEGLLGGAAIDATGDALPPETLDLVGRVDAILVGAVGTPAYTKLAAVRPGSGLLRLRRELGLFANFRPATIFPELLHASPLTPDRVRNLDLLIIRELSSDIYYGQPRGLVTGSTERESINTMRYRASEVERVAHVAFQSARSRRGKLCSIDKANVLETMALWRSVVTEIGQQYPDVELSHMYVDAAAMALVRAPAQFDVIVTGNLFGDILSDEAAAIAGSLGLAPSASLGVGKRGLYEPIHGSAPDIAGTDVANPIGTILSAAMMLRLSLDRPDDADRVERAVRAVLARGLRTADIATEGTTLVGTREMGEAVAAAL